MVWIVLYLMLINALAWAMFGVDKHRARMGQRRISEDSLLLVTLLGGTIGAFAGRAVFRHKTRKQPFVTMLWLCVAAQCVGLVVAVLIFKDL